MKKYIFILGVGCLMTGFLGYWLHVQTVHFAFEGVRLYETRDKESVKKLFQQNTWYLLGDEIAQSYDVDFMLDHKSSVQHAKQNDLRMTVLEQDGSVIGFCAVYKKGIFWGQVLFIVVDQEYRGRGFAKKLLSEALSYLFDQEQCIKVTLVTRIENKAARTLYESIGFVLFKQDDYVEYILYAQNFKKQE